MIDSKRINFIFLFSCFIVSSGAFIYSFRNSNSVDGGDLFTQFFLGSIYLIVIVDILLNYQKTIKIIKQNFVFFSLLALSVASIFWSIYPKESLIKSASLIGITSVGVYMCYKLKYERIINIFFYYSILIATISLIFIFLIPEVSISKIHEGAWMGVFTHKNILGKTISMSVIISYIKFNDFSKSKWEKTITILVLIFSLLLLYKSDSITSLFSLSLAFLVYLLVIQRKLSLWILTIPLLVISILFIGNIDILIEYFGRDLTLSGRLLLWITLFNDVIPNNFFLGYGYSAFWNDLANHFISDVGWAPSHSHNGFIQILVDLGIVGLFIFLLFLIRTIYFNFASLYRERTCGYVILIMVYFIIYNLTEISFLTGNDFMWLFFVVFILKTNMERTRKINQLVNVQFRLIKKEAA